MFIQAEQGLEPRASASRSGEIIQTPPVPERCFEILNEKCHHLPINKRRGSLQAMLHSRVLLRNPAAAEINDIILRSIMRSHKNILCWVER